MITYKDRLLEMKAAHDAWVTRWPNYCRKCEGKGEILYQEDPSAGGISLSPGTMTFGEPCPDCTEQGKCPRCGMLNAWNDDDWDIGNLDEYSWPKKSCQECGWSYTAYTASPDEYSCPPEPYELDEPDEPDWVGIILRPAPDAHLERQYDERTELGE